MKHRIALILLGLGVILFGVVLAGKVSERLAHLDAVAQETKVRAATAPPKAPPALVIPQPGPATETLRLTGTLKPEAEVELGFKLPGRVIEILVKRGARVTAGQVLARIDGRDIEAQAAQARAGMQAARAQRELARDSWQRSKNLQEAGAASEQQVALAGGQKNLGEASIAQAEAAARLVDSLRHETRLVAPIDGVIVRAPTAAGFFAAPGVPLFRIEKLTQLRFHGHLPDRDAARVEMGSALQIRSEAGVEVAGTLDLLIPSVDAATRRIPIEGAVANFDGKLFAGSFVEASLSIKSAPSLVIPVSALVTGEVPAVLVVQGDKLVRRAITVLRTERDRLLVSAGLQASDRVVVSPGSVWRDGDALPPPLPEPAAKRPTAAGRAPQ